MLLALGAVACGGKATASEGMAIAGNSDGKPAASEASEAAEAVTSPTRATDEADGVTEADGVGEAGVTGEAVAGEELPASARCISAHPSGEPFDVGGERIDPITGEVALPTVESIVAECELARGADCNSSLISKQAARCIAEIEQFALGLIPWEIRLEYQYGLNLITWGVANMEERGVDGARGRVLALDAVDGSIVARYAWREVR